MDAAGNRLARNIRRIGHLDLPGGGQVVVQDGYAYIGHMKPPHGTTISETMRGFFGSRTSRIVVPWGGFMWPM